MPIVLGEMCGVNGCVGGWFVQIACIGHIQLCVLLARSLIAVVVVNSALREHVSNARHLSLF